MDTRHQVDILLSTYNGEKFISDQLESLLQQGYCKWRLIIRDDGSTDTTSAIINKYVGEYPNQICIIEDNKQRLGACQSFASLLRHSTSNYIMFCDQDDAWLPNKIELTLNKMLELESLYNNAPILVHTDLSVVDRDLNVLGESFWHYQNIKPQDKELIHLIVQNNVTGCTVMINRNLKDLIQHIPKEAVMHDWWLAIIAAALGVVSYLEYPTMLYRQHGSNDTGAKKYTIIRLMKRLREFNSFFLSNIRIADQSKAFLQIYRNQIPDQMIHMLEAFSVMYTLSKWKRLKLIWKYNFRKNGFIKNIGFILVALAIKKRRTFGGG